VADVREKRSGSAGNLRGGARYGYLDCRYISGGLAAVRDGVSADCVRLRLLPETVKGAVL
jgi:hypothetical protein